MLNNHFNKRGELSITSGPFFFLFHSIKVMVVFVPGLIKYANCHSNEREMFFPGLRFLFLSLNFYPCINILWVVLMQFFEETFSPTVEAAVLLQPRCSEKSERDSGIISFTTRLLVSSSRIGCLIGKGGSIITEMRRLTKSNIRILSKENLPKIASDDDEMVQVRILFFSLCLVTLPSLCDKKY